MDKKKLAVLLLAVVLVFTLCACGEKTYTVTFDLNGGTLVSGETTQTVAEGEAAVPPVVEMEKYTLSWAGDYSNIIGNTVITAQWTSNEMSSKEVAAYTEKAVVTVLASGTSGDSEWESTGSGFFIDENGTLVTNYHVIDRARAIEVSVSGGGNYDVTEIVGFSPAYDIAILKIDYKSEDYLTFCYEASVGESVYAVGSSLGELDGSFTSGTLSSANRKYGIIECYQMDAAISSGNSGGPLVNSFGEVIGICSYSYIEGQNNNLAIKLSEFDKVDHSMHYSLSKFAEWFDKENGRSYSPWDCGDEFGYYYSLVNRYEIVNEDSPCLYSYYRENEDPEGELVYEEGYIDCCLGYDYNYVPSEYDNYIEYLSENGFEYNAEASSDDDYLYYNPFQDVTVELVIFTEENVLYIQPLMGDYY